MEDTEGTWGNIWRNYWLKLWNYFFREPFNGQPWPLLSVHGQYPLPSDTGMTICAFYLFERLNIFSLSNGKENLFDEEISIPIWGGHWSYMCAWMFVYATMGGCVCKHESVQGVAVAPMVSLVNILHKHGFFLMPHCIDKYSHITTFCHSPADNCCLCCIGKAEHLIWTRQWNFIWKWRSFCLATYLRAPGCSLILFDRPSFDLDKKGVSGPPRGSLWEWRHFRILFLSLGNSWGVARYSRCIQRDCCADPKCCMKHLCCDWLTQCCFTQIFRSRQRTCDFGGKHP